MQTCKNCSDKLKHVEFYDKFNGDLEKVVQMLFKVLCDTDRTG